MIEALRISWSDETLNEESTRFLAEMRLEECTRGCCYALSGISGHVVSQRNAAELHLKREKLPNYGNTVGDKGSYYDCAM